jgi:hypothetical protein
MFYFCAMDESKFTKEYIQALLMREDEVGMHAVGRALVLLHNRQTYTEQRAKEVQWNNGRGFTPTDAEWGTDMARFYLSRNFLSPRQLAVWRRPNSQGIPRICKYWRQIQEDAMQKHGIQKLSRRGRKQHDVVDSGDLLGIREDDH